MSKISVLSPTVPLLRSLPSQGLSPHLDSSNHKLDISYQAAGPPTQSLIMFLFQKPCLPQLCFSSEDLSLTAPWAQALTNRCGPGLLQTLDQARPEGISGDQGGKSPWSSLICSKTPFLLLAFFSPPRGTVTLYYLAVMHKTSPTHP